MRACQTYPALHFSPFPVPPVTSTALLLPLLSRFAILARVSPGPLPVLTSNPPAVCAINLSSTPSPLLPCPSCPIRFAAFFPPFLQLPVLTSNPPALPVSEFPFIIAYAPTEPILRLTRAVIQPIGGVDIAPIVWLALISFLNEILLGQQGLLVLIANQESLL
ncbi:unnamed protein product [Closterium sp. NIES-64]|nr:unnamed protein product [Closterium sp. NIES-64]CAI5947848.1 unnamed protein product [Closterium sp. NIES-65]